MHKIIVNPAAHNIVSGLNLTQQLVNNIRDLIVIITLNTDILMIKEAEWRSW